MMHCYFLQVGFYSVFTIEYFGNFAMHLLTQFLWQIAPNHFRDKGMAEVDRFLGSPHFHPYHLATA